MIGILESQAFKPRLWFLNTVIIESQEGIKVSVSLECYQCNRPSIKSGQSGPLLCSWGTLLWTKLLQGTFPVAVHSTASPSTRPPVPQRYVILSYVLKFGEWSIMPTVHQATDAHQQCGHLSIPPTAKLEWGPQLKSSTDDLGLSWELLKMVSLKLFVKDNLLLWSWLPRSLQSTYIHTNTLTCPLFLVY